MSKANQKKAYQLSNSEVIAKLDVDSKNGLNSSEVKGRQRKFGPNQLPDQQRRTLFSLLLEQFKDFMVLVLIGAVIISGLLGQVEDAIAIIAIVILNAIMGFIQEYRAEKSLQALKKLAAPEATVLRNGAKKKVPTEELVPGDIIYLESGDKIPADVRLIELSSLEVNEASLTGESIPVKKETEAIKDEDIALGDRKNMAYMGTTVVKGKAKAVITDIGLDTEMGRIADMLRDTEERETPLQQRLKALGRWLVYLCFLACAAVVVLGVLKGEPLYRMFLAGVSLAVAAIPEGLPAIVTLSLAIGVQRMIKRQAIVRKLPAVETLGCATVICSDKTGTLTKNEMTVKKLYTNRKLYSAEQNSLNRADVKEVLKIGAICNNAEIRRNHQGIKGKMKKLKDRFSSESKRWKVLGDPTEGALLLAAQKAGLKKEELKSNFSRFWEVPFDSNRKRMSVIGQQEGENTLYLKGAPDVVLDRCSHYLMNGEVKRLNRKMIKRLKRQNENLASQALRVLAVATRKLPKNFNRNRLERYENRLVFVGLVGMIDPPRPEAQKAIARCKRAGIRPVMVTGDHKNTAQAIAKELNLLNKGDRVITGTELKAMSDDELRQVIDKISVYARVTPEDKLRIVRTLKRKGEVVAMTGDGVNDAPAVKEADIGIAMGEKGTDVTKEASSLILADDNFRTIVAAVEEGRAIYDNIRKFIRYLLSCNIGEILTMFLASLFGFPLPLVPIQILWVNLVTDGLPALALGVDQSDDDIMERTPRPPNESIFAHGLRTRIITQGILIGLSTLFVFILGLRVSNGNLVEARTMAFTNLVMAQLFFVFSCRSERYSLFEMNPFSNLYLVTAVIISFVMQLIVLYIPALEGIFKTTSLNQVEWILILTSSGSATLLVEFFEGVVNKIRERIRYIVVEKESLN
ncbi:MULTISPECIES: calcium-transporting P-type ATPase, PMR1-type [unclassified Candidatus Frackibacter]|uniref:calcium-transporting P-type ATPase, PMR1-type n=1 Tax=unclassified Candidatus Frackibacter TaxID=2648818 RepID=UPI0008834B1F|nr:MULTISPECIES: calcium-transporting P-type ATPase, PMR1-type [unclassified Candidatus Frackibacter]SDC62745.1 Ca2+-transporting ATPase [Candidatus Frackibacter sp. WG11]SEM76490.1 Ca2+-transporting ATPase [Candidatus Frackibacter sp. WG12]SFL86095.1 Ca2+-transporting ATPase [Candidatus Frackibacter sp. WG13]